MKGKVLVLSVVLPFLFLAAVIPQSLATSDNASPDSITAFSESVPPDVGHWPDGTTNVVANVKWQNPMSSETGWNWDSFHAGETHQVTDSDYEQLVWCKYLSDSGTGIWTNLPSFVVGVIPSLYIEFRYRVNATVSDARIYYNTWPQDNKGGTPTGIEDNLTQSTTWTTRRLYLGSIVATAIETFGIYVWFTGYHGIELDIDYVSILQANNMGWEHDCSSTDNTTGFSSSTGDLLYKESSPGDATWAIDATTTAAGINSTSYPFLEINVVDDASGGIYWALNASTATNTYTLHSSGPGTGLFHFNLRSFSADDFFSFTLTTGYIAYGYYIKIDWISVYNIANLTTTITGADINDVAYVSSNALQVTRSSASLFQFDHDPAVSVPSWPYGIWNISTSAPSSAVGLSTYIPSTWTTKDYVTNWTMPAGTSTDVRIRVFSSCAISSVEFLDTRAWKEAGVAELWFDMPNWHIVATAILAFWTAVNTLVLEGLFIVAGLILIPISTLYLVHGGREEMSNDKVFFFLVLFFVGWALLIGGIMP